jgi:LPXTG-motif cell wall-anchored protein
MTLTRADISEAEMVSGEFGQALLQVKLKKDASEKFGQLTGNNISQQLVIIVDNKALIAPIIQSAITNGSLLITAGVGNENKYLDSLPWLKQMSEEKKSKTDHWKFISMISYLILGALLIGGSIFFAFFRKRKRNGQSAA